MSDYYDIHGNPMTIDDWSTGRGEGSDWANVKRETKTSHGTVSTVWLGLDHQYDDGPPLIFESMVFGGGLDQECVRYSTLAEAHAGHEVLVERVRVEADAFSALTQDEALIAAVRLVRETLAAHNAQFSIYDYDSKSFDRLSEATS